jgi:uncharacterized protein
MTPDPWHFPRPALARQYLDFFRTGVSNALILFQQRRYGKTEFCLRDLAPAAEAQGYSVVYANFWQARLAPTALLLHALEKSLERKSISARVREFLTAPVTKLKLSGEMVGAKAEAEIDLATMPQRASTELLLYLSDLTLRVAKRAKGKLLLILDEVQELAESETNDALVAALRTLLDTQRGAVKVVFTGSSQEGLTRMFSSAKAPFFHFGTRIDLPPLDAAFVRHIASVFRETSRARVSASEFVTAFGSLHGNPYYFRKLIELMLVQPKLTIRQSLEGLRERIAEEQGFARLWESLQPIDRALVTWLSYESGPVFNKMARNFIGPLTADTSDTTIHAIQSALRRLVTRRLVRSLPGRGLYGLEDAEFAQWVHAQDKGRRRAQ